MNIQENNTYNRWLPDLSVLMWSDDFVKKYPDYLIVNADKLTYAGNLENLTDIEKSNNYLFEKTDIVDKKAVFSSFSKIQF